MYLFFMRVDLINPTFYEIYFDECNFREFWCQLLERWVLLGTCSLWPFSLGRRWATPSTSSSSPSPSLTPPSSCSWSSTTLDSEVIPKFLSLSDGVYSYHICSMAMAFWARVHSLRVRLPQVPLPPQQHLTFMLHLYHRRHRLWKVMHLQMWITAIL